MLAPNLGASDASERFDQASGLTTIPTAAVLRVAELNARLVSSSPAGGRADHCPHAVAQAS